MAKASVATTALAAAPAAAGLIGTASLRDYVTLLKPRVMTLVVFTGIVGLLLAPSQPHWLLSLVAILALAVGAGAAGAINMWYDRDIDAVMARTRTRPLPRGRVEPSEALAFGIILSFFSVLVMGVAINWLAAGLLALANGFYVFVYTLWLKRRTPYNIVIGGAAGAFPPMIGWAAATGELSLAAFVLFLVIFFWTPPHFWALALYRREDYARAGVPMLPVTAGDAATKRQIVLYCLLLLPLGLVPSFLGLAGVVYGFGSLVLGGLFLAQAWIVKSRVGPAAYPAARRLFAISIFYLFALFALLLLDKAPGLLGGLLP